MNRKNIMHFILSCFHTSIYTATCTCCARPTHRTGAEWRIILGWLTEWSLTPFQRYFSYIEAVCAPIHAFLEFFTPLLRTIFFPSHWLPFHITIVETTDSGARGMNPVAITIINPRKEYWLSWGSNQRLPALKSATLPTELWGSAYRTGTIDERYEVL